MEERPVDPIQRDIPTPPIRSRRRRRNRRDLPPSCGLDIHLPGLGSHSTRLALNHTRPTSLGNSDQRPRYAALLLLARALPGVGAEPGRDQRALGPLVGDAGKVPLDAVRVGVPVELVAEVDEGLRGGDVEEVDGREVEDDGAEGGAGGDFLAVDDLAAARAGVVPGAVLGGLLVSMF